MTLDSEKTELFRITRKKLGMGVRKVELSDDDLCDLLSLAVGDYAQMVQSFVIENNWASLYGKNMSNTDIAFALSARTLDITKDYASWFSKEVGLQNGGNGTWELKKDFIKLEKGKQVYIIPSGRVINKILWITPPTTDQALFANYGGFGVSFGGGVVGQMGLGAATAFGGISGYGMGAGIWALPAYDVSLMAADLKTKNQLFRSDLTYKVTSGPNGTHLLHLMSTPGSKLTFGAGGVNMYPLQNCYCWYTYYDTNSENIDDCLKQNPDVLLTPDQVPLNKMDYSLFNEPTKALIRQLLIAHAAETLSFIRGKFSGNVSMINNPLQMDYTMYMTYGNNERKDALNTLKERLERLSPYYTMQKQAELVDSSIKALKGVPLGIYAIG